MSRQLDVSPGAFAFVMATGIVARGAHLTVGTFGWIVLLGVAVIGYLLLLVLTMLRIVYEPRQVLTDLASHRRGPGALALVAATGILGIELAPFSPSLATALWLLQLLLWLIVTYAFFTAIVAHERKPQATRALSGSWLLTVVATDSVALLATLVASQFEAAATGVLFIATSLFFSACVLYFALIPLIVNRLEFLSLTPQEFTPDYWINMGAMAITALTGTMLISSADNWPVLGEISPFLLGLSLLFWAGATWWIPLLVALEAWRHVFRRVRLRYAPEYWSMVFPVGMYAACTFALEPQVHIGALSVVAQWMAYVAVSLWLIAFVGLVRYGIRALGHRKTHHPTHVHRQVGPEHVTMEPVPRRNT